MEARLAAVNVFVGICLLALAVFPKLTSSCSCMPHPHPQTALCQADFVIKANVKKSKIIYSKQIVKVDGKNIVHRYPFQIRYFLHVSKIFKESEAYRNATRKDFIYTAPSTSMCGLHLQNNTKYVLTGFMAGNKPYVSLCSWVKEWRNVTLRQRKGFSFKYEESCHCNVKFSYGAQKLQKPKDICLLERRNPNTKCYQMYNLCKQRDDGHCKWGHTKQWQACVDEAKKEAGREP